MTTQDHVISVRIDEDMYNELLGISEELGISLSRCASVCLRIYLSTQGKEDEQENE